MKAVRHVRDTTACLLTRAGRSRVRSALRIGILALREWLCDADASGGCWEGGMCTLTIEPYGEYLVVARERRMSPGTSLSGEPSWEETMMEGECLSC